MPEENTTAKQHDEESRQDWSAALASVEEGEDLSMDIGWCFTDDDIKELAKLHKANQHREKIESLLVDCNFITEACDFNAGKYDAYL